MLERLSLIKVLLFLICLVPLLWLVYGVLNQSLGANPIETITRTLGDWALRLLLLTLAVTPLRKLTSWRWPMRLRRMLGLFAFFYALLHLSSYIVLDQFFYWPEIWADIIKRPYITVGMLSFLMLIPLAVTSTNAMMRRLGRNWARLHRLVYLIATAAVAHQFMLAKVITLESLLYILILALLLLVRLPRPAPRPRSQHP